MSTGLDWTGVDQLGEFSSLHADCLKTYPAWDGAFVQTASLTKDIFINKKLKLEVRIRYSPSSSHRHFQLIECRCSLLLHSKNSYDQQILTYMM